MANPFDQFVEPEQTTDHANPFDQFVESEPEPVTVRQAEEPGFFHQAAEAITGSERETRATEELPELAYSGLLSGSDMLTGVKVVPAILTADNPEEIADIITSNYPEIGKQYDRKGNLLLANNKTGARAVVNKPGFSSQDALNLLGLGSLYASGGGLGSVGKSVAGKAATKFPAAAEKIAKFAEMPIQAATELIKKYPKLSAFVGGAAGAGAATATVEAGQEAVGGEFNLENVLADMAVSGVLDYAPALFKSLKGKSDKEAADLTGETIEAEAVRAGQPLSPEQQARQQAIQQRSTAEQQENIARQLSEEQQKQTGLLGKLAGKKDPALKQLPEDVAPDVERLEAAERLGVKESLLPSHVSDNQSYIEIEQGLASIPGSKLSIQQKEAQIAVAQKADDLITEFGGSTDKAGLSERMKGTIIETIGGLDDEAEVVYKEINDLIPKTTRTNPTNIREALEKAADEVGGFENLESVEKKIFNLVRKGKTVGDTPTYAKLDKERKKIGQALRKASGPYKDSESGTLKYLYRLMTEAQEKTAVQMGADDLWSNAKSLVQQRKELEDDSIFLLGKNLTGAIMPKVGQAVKKLTTGDYKAFDETMSALPKEMRQEAVVSALNDAFTLGSRKEKQLSAPGFVDWYEGLNRNKAAKQRIEKYLPPEARQRMNDLFTVARGMRRASEEKITTGRIQALLDNFGSEGGLVSKLYQTTRQVAAAEGAGTIAGFPLAGTVGVLAGTIAGRGKDPLSKAADDMLSDHVFQNAVRSYADTSTRAELKRSAADRAIAKSEKYKQWLKVLPNKEKQKVLKVGLITYLTGDEL